MPVVAGAIVPHAPLLLPQLESPEVAEAARTITEAIASIRFHDAAAIVLLTPHASSPGMYREIVGDLASFGVPGFEMKAETHPDLGATLGLGTIDDRIDHGVLVPLSLGDWKLPVVAVGVDAHAALRWDTDVPVAVVASMNGSAGLSPRAPLTEVAGAAEAERRFVASLREDLSSAASIDLPGSCGRAVIAAFAGIFGPRRVDVLAHEAPVGVGYTVAQVE